MTTDQCVKELERMIRSGEIAREDRLSESSLAERFGASKANVAKAFERLVARRILIRSAKSGTYLRLGSIDEYFDALEVRTQLEMLAAQRLARHCLPEELETLRQSAEEVDQFQNQMASGDQSIFPELCESDRTFHDHLIHLAGNQVQIAILKDLRLVQYDLKGVELNDRKRMAFHAHPPRHTDIVNAIASGHPDYAGNVTRIHIQNGANTLVSCMTNQLPKFEALPPPPTAAPSSTPTTSFHPASR